MAAVAAGVASKRRRVMESGSSESEPEEADGGESEEADGPCSMIWKAAAAGPLTMREDMQHDSQVVHTLGTGDLAKQTKPVFTVPATGAEYVEVSAAVADTDQEVVGWVTYLLGREYPPGLQEIPEAEHAATGPAAEPARRRADREILH